MSLTKKEILKLNKISVADLHYVLLDEYKFSTFDIFGHTVQCAKKSDLSGLLSVSQSIKIYGTMTDLITRGTPDYLYQKAGDIWTKI